MRDKNSLSDTNGIQQLRTVRSLIQGKLRKVADRVKVFRRIPKTGDGRQGGGVLILIRFLLLIVEAGDRSNPKPEIRNPKGAERITPDLESWGLVRSS